MKITFEKKIIAKKNLNKGVKIKISDLNFKKSKSGIRAFEYHSILDTVTKKKIFRDRPINKLDLKLK